MTQRRWTIHSGAKAGNREGGDSETGEEGVKKIVSLDNRNWRRLIHSDLNKTPTCFASFFFASPLFRAAKSAPNGKNTLR